MSKPAENNWSPCPNLYDDLRTVNSLSRPKLPTRTTSAIDYMSPRAVDIPTVKRSTVSLIMPAPMVINESTRKLDTILSVDDTELLEQDQHSKVNKNQRIDFGEGTDQQCIYWIINEIIWLICLTLFVCFIGILIFTFIFYSFDAYWFEPLNVNDTLWWMDFNDTNRTSYDYDMISLPSTTDWNDEY